MKHNRRAWSTVIAGVAVALVALLQPAAAGASRDRSPVPAAMTAGLSPANFTGLGTVPGMRACSAGDFAPYDTKTAAYQDNVVSWPSVEPADDYTAGSLLAFALGAAGLG